MLRVFVICVAVLVLSRSSRGSDVVFGKDTSILDRIRVSIQAPFHQGNSPFSLPSFANVRRGGGVAISNSSCMSLTTESNVLEFTGSSSISELRANETYAVVPTEYDRVFVDLENDQRDYPISNELFEGKMRLLLREDPKNEYDFRGDQNVHWELQIQVG
mmetsp:Transcript_20446/g.59228  ORF Transcript_20446/g.59228 Transcript_20446/m.59228 type:complete len:160 (+) Transcript_20446:212-691(+)